MTQPNHPRRVVVIGGGMLGLATAWHLQELGVEVVVLDRSGVAAGASWGNAGWISPGLAIPLAEPSVLKYGFKSLFDRRAALSIPLAFDPDLWKFLAGFARRCTMRSWRRTMADYVPLNRLAISAYDELAAAGVTAKVHQAPILAAFLSTKKAAGLIREIDLVRKAGLELKTEQLSGAELRAALPIASEAVQLAIRIDGQRYIDPGEFVGALANSVRDRGGEILPGASARTIRQAPGGLAVELYAGEPVRGDAVVIATGAWLPELAKPFGVRTRLRAGRGYSFSIPVANPPVPSPIYFPHERVACTPIGDRLRIAGTMEFRDVDAPIDMGRVAAMISATEPLLRDVDWARREDVWVGGRPVTVDGRPLIGVSAHPGVYVAGGHGMWGITLGPISGKLLAEQIVTGRADEMLKPFDPTR